MKLLLGLIFMFSLSALADHHESHEEKMKEAHEACQEDIKKLCNDVPAGKGRVMKCLKRHKDELSQSCKDATARKKK